MGSSSDFFNLTWNEFQSTVAYSFMDLRTKDEFLDVTLAIDEDHQCQAHKVILSAASPYFRSVLKRNPAQHPILVMPPKVRYSDLTALLDFIYQGEVKIPTIDLEEFLALAQHLKIKGLTESTGSEPKNKPPPPKPQGSGGKIPPAGPSPSGPGGRRRPSGPPGPPAKTGPQAKRHRMGGNVDPNFGSMPPSGPSQNQGENLEDVEDVHALGEEDDGSEMYDDYGEQYEGGQDYGMDPSGPPGGAEPTQSQKQGLQLTGLLCPTCKEMCHGVEALKHHMATAHGIGSQPGGGAPGGKGKHKPAGDEVEDKPHSCHICDKAFKTASYVRAHIKRVHKPQDLEHEDPDGLMMAEHEMAAAGMSPVKKKGRKPKMMPGGQQRPIGQVSPAPRSSNEGKEMQEPSRPPVQQDRASMIQRTGAGIRPPMMGRGRPPMGMGISGPGMRPRGPAPQQFQQQYQPRSGVDMKGISMKLGGAISITSSSSEGGPTAARGRPPMPGPSRMNVSSPKNDPLATTSRSSMPRQRELSQEPPPVEVKQEPMDDMYEEGEDIPEDFDEEDYGEEEEEEGLYQDGMYPGEAPYDEDVENDEGEYAH